MTEPEPVPPPRSATAVRQGRITGHVRWILGISMALVVIAFVIAYLLS